jgi:hypothetical protein
VDGSSGDVAALIVRWTARLAVACYLARLAIDVASPPSPSRNRRARLVWTAGCAIFLAHVVAAFHFVHGWSHAAAYEHTRRETLALTGWDSGAGLYFNYVFTAWWLFDVLAWRGRDDWPRHRGFFWPLQAYFAFLVFHATVVFGPRGWIVVAALIAAAFAALGWSRYALSADGRPL